MKERNTDLHGAVPDSSPVAILILDMISDFRFADGVTAARAALPVARRIATLRARASRYGIPTVYVNDHLGRWRSDFSALLRHCMAAGSRGRQIATLLKPRVQDYRVLKPKHSGFFASPLEPVLEHLGTRTLVLTGSTLQQCVLFTAMEAYLRDYELYVPRDCVVSLSPAESRFANYFLQKVLAADQRKSAAIRFAGLRK